jgi:hypothetical protein
MTPLKVDAKDARSREGHGPKNRLSVSIECLSKCHGMLGRISSRSILDRIDT